jgi:hypothetical protein
VNVRQARLAVVVITSLLGLAAGFEMPVMFLAARGGAFVFAVALAAGITTLWSP